MKESQSMYYTITPTCLLRTARLFVCIGDCGSTPFEGGSPSSPQSKVCKLTNKIKKERSKK